MASFIYATTIIKLLLAGLLQESSSHNNQEIAVASYLGIAKIADWNSRLCAWMQHSGNLKGNQTFVNQALNTLYNFSVRPLTKIKGTWYSSVEYSPYILNSESLICTADAREIKSQMDLWITDPHYADAINYLELGAYFADWYEKGIAHTFPEWTSSIRSALAVKGNGHNFKQAMVEIYTNLANNMPDNGLQMVQFTHQDPRRLGRFRYDFMGSGFARQFSMDYCH